MTWIKTVRMEEDPRVAEAMLKQRAFYPSEYATPVEAVDRGTEASITAAHSLIPEAMYHSFAAFGAMMSSELPLRREQHEMIATVVSVANRCHY